MMYNYNCIDWYYIINFDNDIKTALVNRQIVFSFRVDDSFNWIVIVIVIFELKFKIKTTDWTHLHAGYTSWRLAEGYNSNNDDDNDNNSMIPFKRDDLWTRVHFVAEVTCITPTGYPLGPSAVSSPNSNTEYNKQNVGLTVIMEGEGTGLGGCVSVSDDEGLCCLPDDPYTAMRYVRYYGNGQARQGWMKSWIMFTFNCFFFLFLYWLSNWLFFYFNLFY